jgi:hypothetical protein
MPDKSLSMNVNETLELDYLIEENSDNTINIIDNPDSYTDNYITTKSYIFDPDGVGTYKLDINGQIIEINVSKFPSSTIDDFEDGSLSEYNTPSGSPNEGGSYSITNAISAVSGSNVLKGTTPGDSGYYAFGSDSLSNIPQQGDKFRFFQRNDTNNSTNSGALIGYQDNNNFIRIGINTYSGSNIRIDVVSNGGNVNNSSSSFSHAKKKFYEVRGKWKTDNTIMAKVGEVGFNEGDEITSVSITDNTYQSGGWGWSIGSHFASSGVEVYYDWAASDR